MEQIVEENEKEVGQLNDRIWQLEADIERCNRLVLSWSTKFQNLEVDLAKERILRQETQRELAALQRGKFGTDDTVPLPSRRRASSDASVHTATQNYGVPTLPAEQQEIAFGCGKCRLDTRCECVENALELMGNEEDPITSLKRAHTPVPIAENKRSRQETDRGDPANDDMEIDFTTQSASPRPAIATTASSSSLTATAAPDPCGFCQDGTVCICAELVEAERKGNGNMKPPSSLPLSDSALDASQNPCINGPGSCVQCRSDAKSTLFCKSLAATRSNRPMKPKVAGTTNNNDRSLLNWENSNSNETAMTGVSLSCADAYTTLSRHPMYERASEDPGSWMPNLSTVPTDTSMTAFEIEVASILQTLKYFDKKYAKDK